MKKALITGITGQDGSYLAELLLSKGYEVHGTIRRTSQNSQQNIVHILDKIQLHYCDMTDAISIRNVVFIVRPDEIYNLAGMGQVGVSFKIPANTMEINCLGLLYVIEAVRMLGDGYSKEVKIYQACSSEMFGKVLEVPQKETTPFNPQSPYGVSKAAACHMGRVYRRAYGMKIYNGILFNHESERRGEDFLSRKVCKGIAQILAGKIDKIKLGNLDAKRDFGYAKEYVEWIWNIVQHPEPDDFIIATGETHSVKELVIEAFKCVGIDNWEDYVEYDKTMMRPAEVDLLIGDATKSKEVLGFEPKIKFKELVRIMTEAELKIYGNSYRSV